VTIALMQCEREAALPMTKPVPSSCSGSSSNGLLPTLYLFSSKRSPYILNVLLLISRRSASEHHILIQLRGCHWLEHIESTAHLRFVHVSCTYAVPALLPVE